MFNTTFWLRVGAHVLVAVLAFLVGRGLAPGQAPPGATLWLLIGIALAAALVLALATRPPATPDREAWQEASEAGGASGRDPIRRDALTGLLNRTVFIEQLQKLLDGTRRNDRLAAVLCVDLKDFRRMNETLGAPAGDLLLRHTAARLLSVVRDTDSVARTGADAFAIIQRGLPAPDAAGRLCERLLAVMEEPFDLCGQACRVKVGIGAALWPADGSDAETLVERARSALARAQAAPGSAFRFHDQGLEHALRDRRRLARDLEHALERGELVLHYQPQIEIGSRRMIGLEALLRWQHPERGRIEPLTFIPMAEDGGFMAPIGGWVLDQACAQAVRWREVGAPDLRLAVNVSPAQLGHPDLVEAVAGSLSRSGLAPDGLELEITGRALAESADPGFASLEQLRRLGVRISIDGFGAGPAGLACLQRFRPDGIKLERTLVGVIGGDRPAAAILRACLALARDLDLAVVAEGVETAAQLDFLAAEGCALVQGVYFSPPVAAPEIDSMIRAGSAAPLFPPSSKSA